MKLSNPAVWAGFETPEGMELGWKVVAPDLRSYKGFQWPSSGIVTAKNVNELNAGSCPSYEGDGLCVALTWAGAAAGGRSAFTGLVLAYCQEDMLGRDPTKIRVRACQVLGLLDLQRLLREGHGQGANFQGANFRGADLQGANFQGANLQGADLQRAYLQVADLQGADLRGADLWGANLQGADLQGANLQGANLRGANFPGANFRGANLLEANLQGANLRGADLWGANLQGADLLEANFRGANLQGTNFKGADLLEALNVPEEATANQYSGIPGRVMRSSNG
jgi:uncharacterized protein YjbI with pentapeptide repeats